MRERDIEAYLVRRVREAGGLAYKFTSPNRRHVPDRIVLMPLRSIGCADIDKSVVFVELKAPGKKPTAGQVREHKRLRGLGFRVDVIDSRDGVDAFVDGLV